MTMKSVLVTGTLALCSLTMGYAKSYDLVFSSPVKAGSVELKAGEYTLKVKGTSAVFTNVETAKSFTAPVKVQNTGKKFDVTAVDTNNKNGTSKIQTIELGGSDTQLDFGE